MHVEEDYAKSSIERSYKSLSSSRNRNSGFDLVQGLLDMELKRSQ